MLEDLCEEVYEIRKKEYIYKLDEKGRFVTEMHGHRLVNRDLGSNSKIEVSCRLLEEKGHIVLAFNLFIHNVTHV